MRGHDSRIVGWNEGVGRINVHETACSTAVPSRAMFFRDSFMTGFAKYATCSFSNVLMAGTTNRVYLDEVDRWKPDLVVSEIAERRLFIFERDHELELFDDVFRADYQSPRGKQALKAMLSLSCGEPAQALAHIAGFETELQALRPDHCFGAARIYLANNMAGPAEAFIDRAVSLRPDHASYRCCAARVKMAAGKAEAAVAMARHAMDLAPDNGYYPEVLGYILLSLSRPGEARQVLDAAVQQIRDSANLWYWTSIARRATGDSAFALAAVEQALAISSADPVYRELQQDLQERRAS